MMASPEGKKDRTCKWCEYFDGGGLAIVQRAREGSDGVDGDCLNSRAPHFQTGSDDTCQMFFATTEDWDD